MSFHAYGCEGDASGCTGCFMGDDGSRQPRWAPPAPKAPTTDDLLEGVLAVVSESNALWYFTIRCYRAGGAGTRTSVVGPASATTLARAMTLADLPPHVWQEIRASEIADDFASGAPRSGERRERYDNSRDVGDSWVVTYGPVHEIVSWASHRGSS